MKDGIVLYKKNIADLNVAFWTYRPLTVVVKENVVDLDNQEEVNVETVNVSRKEYETLVFCPACRKNFTVDDNNPEPQKCDCGYVFPTGKILGRFHLVPKPKLYPFGSIWFKSSDERLDLEIENSNCSALARPDNAWIRMESVFTRIVINKKEKTAYQLPFRRNGKAVKQTPQNIKNITWTGITALDGMPEQAVSAVNELLRKELGVDGVNSEEIFIRWKFSAMPKDFADAIINDKGLLWAFGKNGRPKLVSLNNAYENHSFACLPRYMQKKSLKREIAKNPFCYFICQSLWKACIKDVNVMRTILKSNPTPRGTSEFYEAIAPKSMRDYYDSVSTKNFTETVIKIVGSIGSTIPGERADASTLYDTMRMAAFLRSQGCKVSVSGDINAVHDRLSVEYDDLRKGNLEIMYSDEERALETRESDIDFTLPPDTSTLREIGREMKICVGSYDEAAIEKDCTIVCARRGQKPVACIELRGNRVSQLKAACNGAATEIAQEFKDWATKHGLEYDCWDWQRATGTAKTTYPIFFDDFGEY